MKEINVTIGQWYVVEGAAGDTITNPSTGRAIATVEDGKQASFYATSAVVVASSDSVQVHRATFNLAPVKLRLLGLLGGGSTNALPAGYFAAEFLESTARQYINTNYIPSNDDGLLTDNETIYDGDFMIMGSRNDESSDTRFYAYRYSDKATKGYGWGKWLYYSGDPSFNGRITTKINFLNSRVAESDYSKHNLAPLSFSPEFPMFIFAANIGGVPRLNWGGRIWRVQISNKENIAMDFLPAVDKNGVPCMFDKVTKQPFYNSGTGAFVVGMTLAQALKLSTLPATGGTLTISLPSNWQEDEGVVNALATAEANGWVLTYQTYEAAASAASTFVLRRTFALRRIFVRKTQDENGQYIDADGTRWYVEWCAGMIGAEPTDHGYEPYRSVDEAVAYWELTRWVDPEAEKMMQEELLTNSTTNENE